MLINKIQEHLSQRIEAGELSTPGISDIIGFHKRTGQFIACEIKVGKDKLSAEQILFLERVKRAGGVAMEVRGIDQLENL